MGNSLAVASAYLTWWLIFVAHAFVLVSLIVTSWAYISGALRSPLWGSSAIKLGLALLFADLFIWRLWKRLMLQLYSLDNTGDHPHLTQEEENERLLDRDVFGQGTRLRASSFELSLISTAYVKTAVVLFVFGLFSSIILFHLPWYSWLFLVILEWLCCMCFPIFLGMVTMAVLVRGRMRDKPFLGIRV